LILDTRILKFWLSPCGHYRVELWHWAI